MAGYSKFGNRRSESRDGHTFASKRERNRYEELAALQAAGGITGLGLQPRYPLEVNGVKICTYVADFTYHEPHHPFTHPIVEDVKGHRTQLYLMKRRLMKAIFGIEVLET
mgnify:CR=1 FL=1